MHPANIPADLAADNRTIPYGVGHDLHIDVPKDAWLALVVDMLRCQYGEDAPVGTFRDEIVQRLDALASSDYRGVRRLPNRYPRSDS